MRYVHASFSFFPVQIDNARTNVCLSYDVRAFDILKVGFAAAPKTQSIILRRKRANRVGFKR